jgi:hypothetical protein
MPLESGSSREVVSRNIKEMVESGHPQRQAVAASLENARRHPRGDAAADHLARHDALCRSDDAITAAGAHKAAAKLARR